MSRLSVTVGLASVSQITRGCGGGDQRAPFASRSVYFENFEADIISIDTTFRHKETDQNQHIGENMKSMARSLIVMALFAVAPATVHGEVSGGPEAVVRALVLKDKNAKLTTQLPAKPNDYMKKQFTSAFNASWANAMSRGEDEPVLDGDLITGRQTVTRVTLKSSAVAENGDFATVSTNIVYVDEDGPRKSHSETVRFYLKKEQGTWKVDDINAGDLESIRTNFKKSYGQ